MVTKHRTTINLPRGLVEKAHAYGMNVSDVTARAITDEILRIAKQNKALEEITGGMKV
jgi:post-segregation antitoxin (ccd killing protein)